MKTKDKLKKDNMTGENHGGRYANTPVRCLASSTIIGDRIYNLQGERLGKIKEIMLNIKDGSIDYVIIHFGGFLGFGGKYFAIPFDKLSIDTGQHAFVLNQRRSVLENSPGFDKQHWPETNSHVIPVRGRTWGGFMGASTGAEY